MIEKIDNYSKGSFTFMMSINKRKASNRGELNKKREIQSY